jgi:hypothetical protein
VKKPLVQFLPNLAGLIPWGRAFKEFDSVQESMATKRNYKNKFKKSSKDPQGLEHRYFE